MDNIKTAVLTNSYWYLVPILIFNIIYASKLTAVGYLNEPVDIGMMGVVELILRIAMFALPLMIFIDYNKANLKWHLLLYAVGTLLYFASWLLIIYLPSNTFVQTWWVQLAPAYLPITFFVALALMGKKTGWFIPVSAAFIVVHTISTYMKLRG